MLALAALCAASLLSGCVGVAAFDPEDYVSAIPANLDGLGTKAGGTYRGLYTIVLPAGAAAVFFHFEVDVRVTSGAIEAIDLVEPEAMKTADFSSSCPSGSSKRRASTWTWSPGRPTPPDHHEGR